MVTGVAIYPLCHEKSNRVNLTKSKIRTLARVQLTCLKVHFTQSQIDMSFLGRAIETPHVAQFVTSTLRDICSQASLIQNEYGRKELAFHNFKWWLFQYQQVSIPKF